LQADGDWLFLYHTQKIRYFKWHSLDVIEHQLRLSTYNTLFLQLVAVELRDESELMNAPESINMATPSVLFPFYAQPRNIIGVHFLAETNYYLVSFIGINQPSSCYFVK